MWDNFKAIDRIEVIGSRTLTDKRSEPSYVQYLVEVTYKDNTKILHNIRYRQFRSFYDKLQKYDKSIIGYKFPKKYFFCKSLNAEKLKQRYDMLRIFMRSVSSNIDLLGLRGQYILNELFDNQLESIIDFEYNELEIVASNGESSTKMKKFSDGNNVLNDRSATCRESDHGCPDEELCVPQFECSMNQDDILMNTSSYNKQPKDLLCVPELDNCTVVEDDVNNMNVAINNMSLHRNHNDTDENLTYSSLIDGLYVIEEGYEDSVKNASIGSSPTTKTNSNTDFDKNIIGETVNDQILGNLKDIEVWEVSENNEVINNLRGNEIYRDRKKGNDTRHYKNNEEMSRNPLNEVISFQSFDFSQAKDHPRSSHFLYPIPRKYMDDNHSAIK